MPDFSDDYGGRFMNASHVTKPFTATIERVERHDVDGNGKMRTVVFLADVERGIVCNASRYDMVSHLAKSRDTDDWLGVPIKVIRGKTKFAGKPVDCVEFSAPDKSVAAKKAEVEGELNDAIPF